MNFSDVLILRPNPRHPPTDMTCGFLIQLVFCKKNQKTMWFIGVEVEEETSAPPPEKNPGSALGTLFYLVKKTEKRMAMYKVRVVFKVN